MKIQEFYSFFDKLFSRALRAEWDNDGIACCPDPTREVHRVLISLDASEAAVKRAVEGGFDVLLTHHPLLFRGVKALTTEQTVPRKLIDLVRAGVCAMSFHTRLDAANGGVNDILANTLTLTNVTPFAPDGEVPCGRVGTLQEPMRAGDFAAMAARALHTNALSFSGDVEKQIRTVAVLGGEGGDFVDAAREAGADLFLAGRIGYHRAIDAAEEGLCLIEAGHYTTEFPVCAHLAELVHELDASIECEILDAPGIRPLTF